MVVLLSCLIVKENLIEFDLLVKIQGFLIEEGIIGSKYV